MCSKVEDQGSKFSDVQDDLGTGLIRSAGSGGIGGIGSQLFDLSLSECQRILILGES